MNQNFFFQRTVIDLLIILTILNGWWYIALAVAIFSVWSFDHFIEIIIAGVIFDSLFGYSEYLGIAGYCGTILSITIFMIAELVKKFLRR